MTIRMWLTAIKQDPWPLAATAVAGSSPFLIADPVEKLICVLSLALITKVAIAHYLCLVDELREVEAQRRLRRLRERTWKELESRSDKHRA